MTVQQILHIVGLARFGAWHLGSLFRFTVKDRLINHQRTFRNLSIRRDLVACLQEHDVANDYFTGGALRKSAVTYDLDAFLRLLFRLQCGSLAFLTEFTV